MKRGFLYLSCLKTLLIESQEEIYCPVHLGARLHLHRRNTSSKKPGSQLPPKMNFAIFYSTPLHFFLSVARIHRIDCRTHGWVVCVSKHTADFLFPDHPRGQEQPAAPFLQYRQYFEHVQTARVKFLQMPSASNRCKPLACAISLYCGQSSLRDQRAGPRSHGHGQDVTFPEVFCLQRVPSNVSHTISSSISLGLSCLYHTHSGFIPHPCLRAP